MMTTKCMALEDRKDWVWILCACLGMLLSLSGGSETGLFLSLSNGGTQLLLY